MPAGSMVHLLSCCLPCLAAFLAEPRRLATFQNYKQHKEDGGMHAAQQSRSDFCFPIIALWLAPSDCQPTNAANKCRYVT